jgi:hypothetical protein
MRLRLLRAEIEFSEREISAMDAAANTAGISLSEWMRGRLFSQGGAAIALATAVAVEPEAELPIETPAPEAPAPEPVIEPIAAAPPPPPPQKRKFVKVIGTPFSGPVGLEPILELAAIIRQARERIIQESHGADRGMTYNRKMSEFYHQSRLTEDHIAKPALRDIVVVSRNIEDIRAWSEALPPRDRLPDNIAVATLKNLYEKRDRKADQARRLKIKRLAETETELRQAPAPEPVEAAEPETSDQAPETVEAPPVAPEQPMGPLAPVWAGGKFRMAQIPGVTGAASPIEDQVKARLPEPGDFKQVKLADLPHAEARALRRFTEKLLMQDAKPTEDSWTEKKLAAILTKIKSPNERGDTPPTARALIELGVLRGSSGAYRLAPEYLARVDEVDKWAKKTGTIVVGEGVAAK